MTNGTPRFVWNIRALVPVVLILGFVSLVGPVGAIPDEIPGRYIVLLHEGESADDVSRRYALEIFARYESIHGFAATGALGRLVELRNDPSVLVAEHDRFVRAFQTLPTGVDRIDGEENSIATVDGTDANEGEGLDIDIAIIDTGINADHPDLRVAGGVGFHRISISLFEGLTLCGSGTFDDGNGHGTHVAGAVAARDNDIGVVGVAPGARLWAVKVLRDDGSGFLSCVIKGVDWVTANAEEIEGANMSLGGSSSSTLCSAIAKSVAKGVVYAVAAGNSATDAKNTSPANCDDVLATSAVADFNGQPGGGAEPTCRNDIDDTFADFSNFGEVVDIAAPGVCILSTWKDGGYETASGTSMASPHIAGALALEILANGRDRNGDGVVDGNDAAAIREAVIAEGVSQTHACGFSGDPDLYPEPLVYVGVTCKQT